MTSSAFGFASNSGIPERSHARASPPAQPATVPAASVGCGEDVGTNPESRCRSRHFRSADVALPKPRRPARKQV